MELSSFNTLIQAAISVSAFISAVLLVWWRAGQLGKQSRENLAALKEEIADVVRSKVGLENLEKHVSDLSKNTLELTRSVVVLSTKLDEREKDILKLEGGIEMTQRNILDLAKELRTATASLDGLWRTLQRLYPDQIPKRLSDRAT